MDGPKNDADTMERAVEPMVDLVRLERTVLVHCAGAASRSPSVDAAALSVADGVDFVEALPERLRSLKTVNQRERITTRGEVRGRVDWSRTYRQRYHRGYDDPTLFVVETPATEYDIPENRVLRQLIAVIGEAVDDILSEIEYDWRRWD